MRVNPTRPGDNADIVSMDGRVVQLERGKVKILANGCSIVERNGHRRKPASRDSVGRLSPSRRVPTRELT